MGSTLFGRKTAALATMALAAMSMGVVGPAVPASAQVKSDGAAMRALGANTSFPYTQVSLRIPRLSGPGVPAQETAVVTGLDVVVSTQRQAKHGQMAPSEISVSYRGQQLGQIRYVANRIYAFLDVAHWASLPIGWNASTRAKLNDLNLAFGGRWFEVPTSTVAKMAPKGAGTVTPSKIRGIVTDTIGKLVGSLDLSEVPLPGGNERFAERGSLSSLTGAFSQVAKALHATAPTSAAGMPQGTYFLSMSTAGAGRYIADVEMAIATDQGQSFTAELAFTHAAVPVVTPANAVVVTPSMLASLGA
jgi:hypothetical protein